VALIVKLLEAFKYSSSRDELDGTMAPIQDKLIATTPMLAGIADRVGDGVVPRGHVDPLRLSWEPCGPIWNPVLLAVTKVVIDAICTFGLKRLNFTSNSIICGSAAARVTLCRAQKRERAAMQCGAEKAVGRSSVRRSAEAFARTPRGISDRKP